MLKVGDEIIVILTGNMLEGVIDICVVTHLTKDIFNDKFVVTLKCKAGSVGSCYMDALEMFDGKYCLVKEK